MTHIVVATDLGPLSDRALDRGLRLSSELEATASLLYVVEGSAVEHLDESGALGESLQEAAAARLRHLVSAWPPRARKRARPVVRCGSAWREILACAAQTASRLIVVGLHQADPLKDVFIGSTVERLVRHSPVPVLLVRDKPRGPYRRVLAATNFTPASSKALRAAALVAPRGKFRVVHFFNTPFAAFIHPDRASLTRYKEERAEEAASQVHRDLRLARGTRGKRNVEISIVQDDVVHGIGKAVADFGPDLLVLGAHDRGGIFGSLLGSVAQGFVSNPPCDILVSR